MTKITLQKSRDFYLNTEHVLFDWFSYPVAVFVLLEVLDNTFLCLLVAGSIFLNVQVKSSIVGLVGGHNLAHFVKLPGGGVLVMGSRENRATFSQLTMIGKGKS